MFDDDRSLFDALGLPLADADTPAWPVAAPEPIAVVVPGPANRSLTSTPTVGSPARGSYAIGPTRPLVPAVAPAPRTPRVVTQQPRVRARLGWPRADRPSNLSPTHRETGRAVVPSQAPADPEESTVCPSTPCPPVLGMTASASTRSQSAEQRFATKLERWKAALLDLTARNRLLAHRETPSASLSLVRPGPTTLWQRLLNDTARADAAGWRISLADPDANRTGEEVEAEPTPDEEVPLAADQVLPHRRGRRAEKACQTLMRSLRAGLDEAGIHTLFLAFGMLRWPDGKSSGDAEKDWAAPLVLLPVEISRPSVRDHYRIRRTDDDPQLNPALLQKLRTSHGLALPDPPATWDATFDPVAYAEEVAELIKDEAGWSVSTEEVWLDRFDFAKLALFHDLDARADKYEAHPIIRALGGEAETLHSANAKIAEPPPAAEIDTLALKKSHLVLDADSSQQAAIEHVKRGGHLVLEGPPGTGKSQTISNLIAELIAAGKTVLFVSEKRAALDVVWRRLDHVGLGQYCLDLHNPHQVNRRTIAETLNRMLNNRAIPPKPPVQDPDRTLAQIEELRDELRAYVDALHTPVGRAKMTPYAGYQRYHAVGAARDLRFTLDAPLQLTPEQMEELEHDVERLVHHNKILRKPDEHPWSFVTQRDASLGFREAVEDEFRQAESALQALDRWANDVVKELGGELPTTLDTADKLAGMLDRMTTWPGQKPPPREWFEIADLNSLLQRVRRARERAMRLAEDEPKIADRFHESFLETDLASLESNARSRSGPPMRWFSNSYWRDKKWIQSYLLPHRMVEPKAIAEECSRARHVKEDRAWFVQNDPWLTNELGASWYRGKDSDWDAIEQSLQWVADIKRDLPEGPPPDPQLSALLDPARRDILRRLADRGEAACTELARTLTVVTKRFPVLARDTRDGTGRGGTANKQPLPERPIAGLLGWFRERLEKLPALLDWLAFRRAEDKLETGGFGSITKALRGQSMKPGEIVRAVRKRVWRLWLDAVQVHRPALADFRGEDHERRRRRFRNTDALAPQLGSGRVIQQLEGHKPKHADYVAADSELHVLAHQAGLKRGHSSVRRLLARIPTLSRRLMPCWMMSPLSVCQYLTEDHQFDVVVFDEASQVRPEDAVPAIRHAQQCVIVGDRQQLPPTNFFQQLHDELGPLDETAESWEAEATPLESILEEAAKLERIGFHVMRLGWHYRSRDESLIAFSNRAYYDDKLVTFPGPRRRLLGDDEPTDAPPTSDSQLDAAPAADPTPAAEDEAESEDAGASQRRWGDVDGSLRDSDDEVTPPAAASRATDRIPPAPSTDTSLELTPPPDHAPRNPLGVFMVRIDRRESRYKDGRNPAEARALVRHLVDVAHRHPHHSIGIVAFNVAQQQYIEQLVDAQREVDPVLDARFDPELEEPIFIKNLETVQGDERDIILFSVAYGPDPDGKLRLNFGPLQQLGGERRLNVAFTRARFHVRLFTSLRARDIDPERARSLGARRLREYLEYAEDGGGVRSLPAAEALQDEGLPADAPATDDAREPENDEIQPVQISLARALTEAGFDVDMNVGQGGFRIDLAVVHPKDPNAWVLGIETDGETYRSLPTTRDRDRTRPDVLEALGWNLTRVWSRDVFERFDDVVSELVVQINTLAEKPVRLPQPEPGRQRRRGGPDTESGAIPAIVDPSDPNLLLRSVPTGPREVFPTYTELPVEKPAEYANLPDAPTAYLAQQVSDIVREEGPLHRDLLDTRLKNIWEFRARTKSISDAIDKAVALAIDLTYLRADKKFDGFLWPADVANTRPRVPADGATPRDIEHVHPDEIAELLVSTVRHAISLPSDELITTAAHTLGYARTGSKIKRHFEKALARVRNAGRLKQTKNGMLMLPPEVDVPSPSAPAASGDTPETGPAADAGASDLDASETPDAGSAAEDTSGDVDADESSGGGDEESAK